MERGDHLAARLRVLASGWA